SPVRSTRWRVHVIFPGLRIDRGTGTDLLEALDDDTLASRQPLFDAPVVPDDAPCTHSPELHSPVGFHDVDLRPASAVPLHRLLEHCDDVVLNTLLDDHTDIHARQQIAVRIWELAAHDYLAGGGLDGDLRKQQPARMRVLGTVVEAQLDLHLVLADARDGPFPYGPTQCPESIHRLREVCVDRIELLDRGKLVRAIHERALGNERAPDTTRDRCPHLSVMKIELRRFQARLRGRNVGVRLSQCCDSLLELLWARNVALAQLLLPVGLLPCTQLGSLGAP